MTKLPENIPFPQPDSIEYQHSLLCSLVLPRSRQKEREFIREGQHGILKISAGDLYDGKRLIPQPLPYGPKARLALMHICTEAVKTQSRFIEMERSARAFMERIGIGNDGRNYSLFRQQMNALAACRLVLGYKNQDGQAVTVAAQPIKRFEAWVTNDEGMPALWASTLEISEDFASDLFKHAVPISGNAARALSHSAMALDAYAFLAYRLHSLERSLIVTDAQFHAQFGQEYGNLKDFKKEFVPAMQNALKVYPSAKVERVKGGFLLQPSHPPIARQSVAVSRGLADQVKASLPPPPREEAEFPTKGTYLKTRTIETFRKRFPRLDPYACEADFCQWLRDQAKEQPRHYDAAFLGFAAKWAAQNQPR